MIDAAYFIRQGAGEIILLKAKRESGDTVL
jgi:hypothetical protein